MFDDSSYKSKMLKSIDVFTKDLNSLRTGRANASMLDTIKVDIYGQKLPINQLGTITTPEPRTINIQVWDANSVTLIDSAIKKSQLEMKKVVKSMGEKCKVSIRNIRREANEDLKKLLKSKEIAEDEEKKFEKIIQNYTDTNIKLVDEKVNLKEKEIMTI